MMHEQPLVGRTAAGRGPASANRRRSGTGRASWRPGALGEQ
ncbi:protein of unassigned function [Methylobacterium oryzae CBMB20]|uniref:Protein of unassigned function n=1 Tax=Methylobacterium oryzae CBMB20 TaxID=693986 RepID=A0A089NZB5_9HYPH|nr:protein of unassigned function [Methylobacterium oryzae CBMB20]